MDYKNKKKNAAIVIIGNEILSGRTQDVNVVHISKWLNNLGVKVEEVRVIPDKEKAIIHCINQIRRKFNYVFTTGGIGPTHDDITSHSIAKALKLKYGYHKEAYAILKDYYKGSYFNESRKKMTKMPIVSKLIYNPTSGAPGFIVQNIYCLPGVPSILKSMLGGMQNKILGGKKIISETINVKTVESKIAIPLQKVQIKNRDVEIGSYPFFKAGKVGVSIVLRSEKQNRINKCKKQILKFITKKKLQ